MSKNIVLIGGGVLLIAAGAAFIYVMMKDRKRTVFNVIKGGVDSVSKNIVDGEYTESNGAITTIADKQIQWYTPDIGDLPVGSVEFTYTPHWEGTPTGYGIPIFRIGEWPNCTELYISGAEIGAIVLRMGEGTTNEIAGLEQWSVVKDKSYKMLFKWDRTKKLATLAVDGVVVADFSGINFDPWTSMDYFVIPPGSQSATYENMIMRNYIQ